MPEIKTEQKEEITGAQIDAAIYPEKDTESVTVGGKVISVRPLMRRWQSLFYQCALPMFEAEIRPAEAILKAIADGSFAFQNSAKEIIAAELESDAQLDRAAAVIVASQIAGAEKDAEKFINEQMEWLRDHARTEELRAIVEAQAKKERLVEHVGERLPVRFARLFNLAGETGITADSLKQLLNSFAAKLRDVTTAGI